MSSRLLGAAVALSVASALLLAPGPGEAGSAQQRPDLRITGGTVALVGGNLTASIDLENAGHRKAKASTTSLEVDGAVVQSYAARALKKGRTSHPSMSLAAPVPGTHTVRVCADSGHQVRERKEKNNCRTLGSITVPPTTPSPPPPASTVPTAPIPYTPNTQFQVPGDPSYYWLEVPQTYDSTHQTPFRLVVYLHGCGDTAANQLSAIGFAVPLQSKNYIVMTPGGRDGQCWDFNADPALLLAEIADLKTHFNIDPRRVVLGGYSNGAQLATRTAFTHAASFAGLLVVVARPFTTDPDRASSIAGAAWHLNVVMRPHLSDPVFAIANVQADRDALLAASFPLSYSEVAGNSNYGTDDLVYVFGQISDSWTAP